MVAPRNQEDALWTAIASKVSFNEDQSPNGKFLDARHVFKKDSNIITLTVEIENLMKNAATIYATEIRATKLAEARTPYLLKNVRNFAPAEKEKACDQS